MVFRSFMFHHLVLCTAYAKFTTDPIRAVDLYVGEIVRSITREQHKDWLGHWSL